MEWYYAAPDHIRVALVIVVISLVVLGVALALEHLRRKRKGIKYSYGGFWATLCSWCLICFLTVFSAFVGILLGALSVFAVTLDKGWSYVSKQPPTDTVSQSQMNYD